MAKVKVIGDGETITVRVPIVIRKRGGRKLVIAPDGSQAKPVGAGRRVDDALLKAIARAFRWQALLEDGIYATIADIAEAEKINETYVGRILRLAMLAPDIIEMIVGGGDTQTLVLPTLMRPLPLSWPEQRAQLGC